MNTFTNEANLGNEYAIVHDQYKITDRFSKKELIIEIVARYSAALNSYELCFSCDGKLFCAESCFYQVELKKAISSYKRKIKSAF